MCTVLLPQGVNPIAVKNTSYHIKSQGEQSSMAVRHVHSLPQRSNANAIRNKALENR